MKAMGKEKYSGRIIILVVLFLLTFLGIGNYLYIKLWPIPDYSTSLQRKIGSDLKELCFQIKDKTLRKYCLLKIKNPEMKINIEEIKPESLFSLCGKRGEGCIYNIVKFKEREECRKYDSYCHFYWKALEENPFYCFKAYTPFNYLFDFLLDIGSSLDRSRKECFHDAALKWQDPFLCKYTKKTLSKEKESTSPDFCLFSIVVNQINRAEK